jgi:hypothetical protein
MEDVPTLQMEPVSKVHLIGGEKGGVGKSMVSRLLAQYFIDQGHPFIGFDTDRSHGSLMRFYAEFASAVVVDRYEALDKIIEAAVEQPGRRVLVDLAAQTHDPLVKWMDESGVLDMADLSGIAIHYWHVMDNGRDSVDLLTRLLDRFGQRVRYVLVKNHLRRRFRPARTFGPARPRQGPGRRGGRAQAPARRRGAEDRRPQRQLLGRQEPDDDRRPRPRADGAPAPQAVAGQHLRRARQDRSLRHAPCRPAVSSTKENRMSIFGNILRKLFPRNHPAVAGAPSTPAPAPAPTAAATPAAPAAPPAPSAPAAAAQPVDIEAVLNEMAAKNPQKLNWRTSIVDLMKLLGIDSSLQARQELARELHYSGDMNDSAAMNIWLHKQVMNKVAANGGKVPADLMD